MAEERNWDELADRISRRQRKASRVMLAVSVVPIALGACLIAVSVQKVSDAEARVEDLETKARALREEGEKATLEHERLLEKNAQMQRRNEELASARAALEKDIEATREKLASVGMDRDKILEEGAPTLRALKADFDRAEAAELRGFSALEAGDYAAAKAAFEEAQREYPRIHCAQEIAALIGANMEALSSADGGEAAEARTRVVMTILEKHMFGMPKDVGERLIREVGKKKSKKAEASDRKVIMKAEKHLDTYSKR